MTNVQYNLMFVCLYFLFMAEETLNVHYHHEHQRGQRVQQDQQDPERES